MLFDDAFVSFCGVSGTDSAQFMILIASSCMLKALQRAHSEETLLPVMYDVQRRLHLMRATKAHVMRRGFGRHCRVISEVHTDQLLKAMALHGDNADLRE